MLTKQDAERAAVREVRITLRVIASLAALVVAGLGVQAETTQSETVTVRSNLVDNSLVAVSGEGYRGAIVPTSSRWHSSWRTGLAQDPADGDVTAWTPEPGDIAVAERVLSEFITGLAADPRLAGNQLGNFTREPEIVSTRLRQFSTNLPMLPRQYFGVAYGTNRRVITRLLPSVINYRELPVFIKDGGCGNSWWEVDLTERRVRRFTCGGFA